MSMESEYVGGSVNAGGRDAGRNILLGVGLVFLVAACGIGGMLVGRQFLHHEPATQAASVQTRASAAPFPPAGSRSGNLLPVTRDNGVLPRAPTASTQDLQPHAVPSPTGLSAPSGDSETPGQITEDREIGQALERWRTALLTNDSAQIAPSYAAHVNRYFLKIQVSRAFIRDYMERDEERGTRLTKYDLGDVAIRHLKSNEVEVSFYADFAVSTPTTDRAGKARTMLMMRRESGDWKIFYERDFKS